MPKMTHPNLDDAVIEVSDWGVPIHQAGGWVLEDAPAVAVDTVPPVDTAPSPDVAPDPAADATPAPAATTSEAAPAPDSDGAPSAT